MKSSTMSAGVLPYERINSGKLMAAVWLLPGEQLLVLQPFGWHIDGHHIPNAAEQFSREGICEDHGWEVVSDFGPYVAIVRPAVSESTGSTTGSTEAHTANDHEA